MLIKFKFINFPYLIYIAIIKPSRLGYMHHHLPTHTHTYVYKSTLHNYSNIDT